MRLISNVGTDRVIDNLQQCLEPGASFGVATSAWSTIANARVALPSQVIARRHRLRIRAALSDDIARLRAATAKETPLARRVDLNLELKRAEAALAVTRTHL